MASAASATAPDAEPPSAVRPTAGRTSCTPNLRFETRIIAAAADRFIFLPTARYQNAARMSRGSGRRRQTTVRWLPARQVTRTGVWAGVAWRCPPENGAGRDSTAEKRPQNGQKIVYAEEPQRKPVAKRMSRTLKRIKAVLRRRMHHDVKTTAKWLGKVVDGWLNYFAVPTSFRYLYRFVLRLKHLWLRMLRHRSQRDRSGWARVAKLTATHWPKLDIRHPWPDQRFVVNAPQRGATQGRSRMP